MTAAGAPYAAVTDEALEKLASLANIKNRARFKEDVRALIRDIWRAAHLLDPEAAGILGWGLTEFALIALEKSFVELVTAARNVRSAMAAFINAAESDATDSKDARARRDEYLKHLTNLGLTLPPTKAHKKNTIRMEVAVERHNEDGSTDRPRRRRQPSGPLIDGRFSSCHGMRIIASKTAFTIPRLIRDTTSPFSGTSRKRLVRAPPLSCTTANPAHQGGGRKAHLQQQL